MTNPIIAAITPPRETAPADTDTCTRAAFAISRRILKGACACEYAGFTGDRICPERRLASIDAGTIYTGEG